MFLDEIDRGNMFLREETATDRAIMGHNILTGNSFYFIKRLIYVATKGSVSLFTPDDVIEYKKEPRECIKETPKQDDHVKWIWERENGQNV